ncbi:MAG TPA: hypothetical protein VJ917_12750 [Saprospiraceae bacterium]|nr:hypothetical protein [Saprospiraceae bacterium]
MKKLNLLLLLSLLASLMLFTACEDDDDDVTTTVCPGDVCVTENITSDETWTSDNVYVLQNRVVVESGVTLTIEPGVIVKGEAGQGTNATALIIARGATIMAEGTASEPIIFTSVSDEIQPGQIESPNLDASFNGLWGGLIILGNAPISADAQAVQIEGIPPADQNGLYGGTNADDNSGVIKYVSIRHGGTNIGEGNEINGLTLGGVGRGTTIEYVEVVANQDDGIECFGGTVNISNALVWFQGDDAYDMDQDYTGTIDNFIYIGGPDSDHGMEFDGPEGSQDNGGFTLTNGTLIGWNDEGTGGGEYIDFRDGVSCVVENCYFANFSESSDVELDNNSVAQKWIDGDIEVRNLAFNVSHLSGGNMTIEDIWQEKVDEGEEDDPTDDEMPLDAFGQRPIPASVQVVSTPNFGADASVFNGWSLGAVLGNLDNL